jgi:hypothetical protein
MKETDNDFFEGGNYYKGEILLRQMAVQLSWMSLPP